MAVAKTTPETTSNTIQEDAKTLDAAHKKVLIKGMPIVPEDEDDGLRIVLHGYGKCEPGDKHYVDDILFIGGIARDVDVTEAQHLLLHTLPPEEFETKSKRKRKPYGHVKVIVLANNATESQIVRAAGIKPMKADKLVGLLMNYSKEELLAAMGPDTARKFISEFGALIPGK